MMIPVWKKFIASFSACGALCLGGVCAFAGQSERASALRRGRRRSRVEADDQGVQAMTGIPQFTVRRMMVVVAVLALSMSLVHFGYRAREEAREGDCRSQMKGIGLDLASYQSVFGSFPPAITPDASGNPLHSWRATVLKARHYLALPTRYDFHAAWNHPTNAPLADYDPPSSFLTLPDCRY